MATWKRLTQTDDIKVDVNMDQIIYLRNSAKTYPDLYYGVFVSGPGLVHLLVKESPDEIHMMQPLSSLS